jgi:hypothetical protein
MVSRYVDTGFIELQAQPALWDTPDGLRQQTVGFRVDIEQAGRVLEPLPPSDFDLPLREGPIRFAVGSPDGMSSNSWRLWATRQGDVYLACRDNFQNMKVSLHVSGRWRMAFTEEAVRKDPTLVSGGADRAWEVWDEPPERPFGAVAAFRLMFLTDELAVNPDQRTAKAWRDTVFVEAAPARSGKLTTLTLFITEGDSDLRHESEPSFRLASLKLIGDRYAQLVAHADQEGTVPSSIAAARVDALARADRGGIAIPDSGYIYLFGRQPDGARFIVGARAWPAR